MPADTAGALVLMPKFGQSMEAATIQSWHAAEGEHVDEGQVIATVETDKAAYEVEAPAAGPLHILVPEGEEVPVETAIAAVGDIGLANLPAPTPAAAPEATPPAPTPATPQRRSRVLASPRAKRLAAEKGIDLATITASAADGVISEADVERAVAEPTSPPAPALSPPPGRAVRERRRLTGIKRTTARRVLESWQTIPHIVQMVQADATGLVAERARLRASGIDASLNEILLHLAARTMAAHPDLNATIEDETLLLYDGVDIGFAVGAPRGLLVPVIRNAATLGIAELAAESRRLIAAAQGDGLRAEDIGQASLTVSNLGMYGIRAGTPIINLGEPLLIFAGAIEDRPVAIEGRVEVRPTLELSIAYDHRVADGVQAAAFTQALKQAIEALQDPATPDPIAAEPPAEALEPRQLQSTSPGSGLRVDARAPGGHGFVFDETVEHGGGGQGPSPVDALLAGLLGCMTISFKLAAQRRNVAIGRIDARVRANDRGYLKEVAIEIEVWSSAPEADVRTLLERAERNCYVSRALSPELEIHVSLQVHPT